ncbi:hypothetical protein B5F64_06530 [Thomasclavelia spiroformis]|nr:hypothetical protein B5F64_06530 [Thomasclavelia spiroformis]
MVRLLYYLRLLKYKIMSLNRFIFNYRKKIGCFINMKNDEIIYGQDSKSCMKYNYICETIEIRYHILVRSKSNILKHTILKDEIVIWNMVIEKIKITVNSILVHKRETIKNQLKEQCIKTINFVKYISDNKKNYYVKN